MWDLINFTLNICLQFFYEQPNSCNLTHILAYYDKQVFFLSLNNVPFLQNISQISPRRFLLPHIQI